MGYDSMTLRDKIRETLGGGEAERTFRYHCRQCDTAFEAAESSRTNVACPDCGAEGPRSISKL